MNTNIYFSKLLFFTIPIVILLTYNCDIPEMGCPPPPELSEKDTMQATIGMHFNEVINYTGIESHDEDVYSYKYNYSVGKLPKGIIYRVSDFCLYIYGIPEEEGLFTFQVILNVSFHYYDYDMGAPRESSYVNVDEDCDDTVYKDYYIRVK